MTIINASIVKLQDPWSMHRLELFMWIAVSLLERDHCGKVFHRGTWGLCCILEAQC